MIREPLASIIGGIALTLIICAACRFTFDHPGSIANHERQSVRSVLEMPSREMSLNRDERAYRPSPMVNQ